jgi:hypothetical protein
VVAAIGDLVAMAAIRAVLGTIGGKITAATKIVAVKTAAPIRAAAAVLRRAASSKIAAAAKAVPVSTAADAPARVLNVARAAVATSVDTAAIPVRRAARN